MNSIDLILRAKQLLDDNLALPDYAIIDGVEYVKPEINHAENFLDFWFGDKKTKLTRIK